VRVRNGEIWVEASEEVLESVVIPAVANGTLRLERTDTMEQLTISVDQPIETGQQARRRLVIEPTPAPAEGTEVRLTIEPEALKDLFLNQLQQTAVFTFDWPAQSVIVQDATPPRVELVAVRGGLVDIELSEEVDPAVASSLITIDTATTTWTLDSDGYTLHTTSALGNGTHELRVGTAALDLAGLGLAEEFVVDLPVDPLNPQVVVHQTVDPRLVESSTVENPFGFQGLQLDDETGLLYVRNRYFDPELGRFISPDPLGFVDGPSMYTFGGNDPTNQGDSLGLCFTKALKETSVCQTVNQIADAWWGGDEDIPKREERETRDAMELAKKEAVNVSTGVASSPRIKQDVIPRLNHGSMPTVKGIVVHQTGADNANSTISQYKNTAHNPKALGAHFLIDEDGKIIQTANVDQMAAHVGTLKSRCTKELSFCAAPTTDPQSVLKDLIERWNVEKIRKAGGTTAVHAHEKTKDYPLRYPFNTDSIGIEITGAARDPNSGSYPYWGQDATYDAISDEQNKALTWLVGQLKRVYGLGDEDVYIHSNIAIKNPNEAQTADWNVSRKP